MITRIRYVKKDNMLVSKESMLGAEFTLEVEIDTNTNTCTIIGTDADGGEKILETSTHKTLAKVKKHVKQTFKSLGVQFSDEVRNRKPKTETITEVASPEVSEG